MLLELLKLVKDACEFSHVLLLLALHFFALIQVQLLDLYVLLLQLVDLSIFFGELVAALVEYTLGGGLVIQHLLLQLVDFLTLSHVLHLRL